MDETLQAIIFLLVFYTFFLISLYFSVRVIKRYLLVLRHNAAYREEVRRRQQMMAEMKENGEFHEWITIQQTDLNGQTHNLHVCRRTGWCPELQEFFKMSYVHAEVLKQEYRRKYEEYRDAQVEALAAKFNHSKSEMEEIVKSVFDIKKQFTLSLIKERNSGVRTDEQS